MFGKKKTVVELGRRQILNANLEDLAAAKRLVAKVGLRCKDLLTANELDAHAFAQKEMAERTVVALHVLEGKTKEAAA